MKKYLPIIIAPFLVATAAHADLVTDATTALTTQKTSAETLAIAALAIVAVLALFALVKRLLFAR